MYELLFWIAYNTISVTCPLVVALEAISCLQIFDKIFYNKQQTLFVLLNKRNCH